MSQKSMREKRRQQAQRVKTRSALIWGGVTVIIITILGFGLWKSIRPVYGQDIPVMEDTGHVDEGQDPGPFNSDPPTSGRHYASEYKAGFYDESSPEAQATYPAGYLVHNLEHGYVIIWYNCKVIDQTECEELQDQIRSVLDAENNFKSDRFSLGIIDVLVVLTSWAHLEKYMEFDPQSASEFISRNRNRAPEPNAPLSPRI